MTMTKYPEVKEIAELVEEFEAGLCTKEELIETIEQALDEQKKLLKLEAQANASPDGYVHIDNLFKGVPDMKLEEFAKLTHKQDI